MIHRDDELLVIDLPDMITVPASSKSEPKTRHALKDVVAGCLYREKVLAIQDCPGCRGEVEIKVYGCSKHKLCTIATPVSNQIACCIKCPDFEPCANSASSKTP